MVGKLAAGVLSLFLLFGPGTVMAPADPVIPDDTHPAVTLPQVTEAPATVPQETEPAGEDPAGEDPSLLDDILEGLGNVASGLKQGFDSVMGTLSDIKGFIVGIPGFFLNFKDNLIKSLLGGFGDAVGDLFHSALMIETLPGLSTSVLSPTVVQTILGTMYGFMLLLLTLKFIWKGVKVYILWHDGDAETSPVEMVKGAVLAIATAAAVPVLYPLCISVISEIVDTALAAIGFPTQSGNLLQGVISTIFHTPLALLETILVAAYVILLVVVYFKNLSMGVELLIWRLGVPFAVVGQVDSDGGVWKPYAQALFRQIAAIMIQYFLILLGSRVIVGMSVSSLTLGVAINLVAFKSPRLLQQFITPTGGGGGMASKVQTFAMAMRAFAAF